MISNLWMTKRVPLLLCSPFPKTPFVPFFMIGTSRSEIWYKSIVFLEKVWLVFLKQYPSNYQQERLRGKFSYPSPTSSIMSTIKFTTLPKNGEQGAKKVLHEDTSTAIFLSKSNHCMHHKMRKRKPIFCSVTGRKCRHRLVGGRSTFQWEEKIGLRLSWEGNGQSMMRLQDNHRIYSTLFFVGTKIGEKTFAIDVTKGYRHTINKGGKWDKRVLLFPSILILFLNKRKGWKMSKKRLEIAVSL